MLASYNVSIDDNDSSISYSGSDWEQQALHPNSLDFDGSHAVSTSLTDTATFTFTGECIFFCVAKSA